MTPYLAETLLDNLELFMESAIRVPFRFVGVNHPRNYEDENFVFTADEDIEFLSDYIFAYMVEDTTTSIPDYSKSSLLTFDNIALQKGNLLQIYSRLGDDTTAISFDTGSWRPKHAFPKSGLCGGHTVA